MAQVAQSGHQPDEADIATGIAIVLVVYGHLAAGEPARGAEWYAVSSRIVDLFAMPFLMFLCGLSAGRRPVAVETLPAWFAYVRHSFIRLLPAYLLFGMAFNVGKLFAAHYAPVDAVPPSLIDGVADLLFFPERSGASHLWFIYVLFLHHATLPPLLSVFAERFGWAVALGLAFQFADGSQLLAMDAYLKSFVFFVGGVWIGRNYAQVAALLDRRPGFFVAAFAALLAMAVPLRWPMLPVALAAIPALLALARLPRLRFLASFGRFWFPIYLMNPLAIAGITTAGFGLLPLEVSAPLLLASGLLLPILAKRALLVRIPALDRITG